MVTLPNRLCFQVASCTAHSIIFFTNVPYVTFTRKVTATTLFKISILLLYPTNAVSLLSLFTLIFFGKKKKKEASTYNLNIIYLAVLFVAHLLPTELKNSESDASPAYRGVPSHNLYSDTYNTVFLFYLFNIIFWNSAPHPQPHPPTHPHAVLFLVFQ